MSDECFTKKDLFSYLHLGGESDAPWSKRNFNVEHRPTLHVKIANTPR